MQLNPSVSVMNAEIADSCTHACVQLSAMHCTKHKTNKQTNKQKTAGYLTI